VALRAVFLSCGAMAGWSWLFLLSGAGYSTNDRTWFRRVKRSAQFVRGLSGSKKGLVRVVQQFRGILMLVAAGIAFYRGWKIHTGDYAVMAYVLARWRSGLQSGT